MKDYTRIITNLNIRVIHNTDFYSNLCSPFFLANIKVSNVYRERFCFCCYQCTRSVMFSLSSKNYQRLKKKILPIRMIKYSLLVFVPCIICYFRDDNPFLDFRSPTILNKLCIKRKIIFRIKDESVCTFIS